MKGPLGVPRPFAQDDRVIKEDDRVIKEDNRVIRMEFSGAIDERNDLEREVVEAVKQGDSMGDELTPIKVISTISGEHTIVEVSVEEAEIKLIQLKRLDKKGKSIMLSKDIKVGSLLEIVVK